MHIVIGLLTAIAGLFLAINAMKTSGAWDSLNPFLWRRRRHWQKKYHANPLYQLTKPIDVACVLIVGAALSDGELSAEQKQAVLTIFQDDLHLDAEKARAMFVSSSHLLKNSFPLADKTGKIVEHSISQFSQDQKQSVLSLMEKTARFESDPSQEQRDLVSAVSKAFNR